MGAAAGLLALLPAASPTATLDLEVAGLRSTKGSVRLCVTQAPESFPGCTDDANAVRRVVPAGSGAIRINGIPSGTWAAAIIHDENDNGRLDTFAGVPREGFGFSRNPPIRFGPARFDSARFALKSGAERQQVKVRYLL